MEVRFGWNYGKFLKTMGSRNQDCTVHCLRSWCCVDKYRRIGGTNELTMEKTNAYEGTVLIFPINSTKEKKSCQHGCFRMCISFLRSNFRDVINKIKRHAITNPVNSESVVFVDVSMVAHSEILLSKCAQFREQGEFIDVHLKVGEELFSAHRIVLAASSDYFHAMFAHGMKESNQEAIELKDESISAVVLKIVLDSIYSGDILVNDENVFDVLVAADHLQVTSVIQQCCGYLQTQFVQLRFDVQTYCQICTIADRHGLIDLQEATQSKMASMYKDVCENEEFLSHIDADQYSSLLRRDDLGAPSETFVFKSVIKWIKHKKEERMAVAAKVIGAVRLGLVDIRDVIEELDAEEMQQVPEIHMLLHESLLHNNRPLNSSKFALENTKPRSTKPVRTIP